MNDLIESNYCKINVFKNAFCRRLKFFNMKSKFKFIKIFLCLHNDSFCCICTFIEKITKFFVFTFAHFKKKRIIMYKFERFVKNLFLQTYQRNDEKTMYSTILFQRRFAFVFCFMRNSLYVEIYYKSHVLIIRKFVNAKFVVCAIIRFIQIAIFVERQWLNNI